MDKTAFFKLSYGVFLLATQTDEKINACITNTCMQVASDPVRVCISCLNKNLTCEMIKKSGFFALSVLDMTCPYETIRHFGMQSGRDVDKFDGMELSLTSNGLPYLPWCSCAVISCKVISMEDLGTHTVFIAEVTDAEVLSSEAPMTYAEYQEKVKPKAAVKTQNRKIVAWKCKICGYIYEGSELPSQYLCPLCGHDASDFEPVYES